MLKLLGMGLMVSGCIGFGFYKGNQCKRRREELLELKKMMLLLKGEIKYQLTPLPEALSVVGKKLNSPFGKLLEKMGKELNSHKTKGIYPIWSTYIKELEGRSALLKEDRKELLELGERLGGLDRETQLGAIIQYEQLLDFTLDEVQTTLSQKVKLCHTLGITGGLFLFILLL